jgi:hypothetical protein
MPPRLRLPTRSSWAPSLLLAIRDRYRLLWRVSVRAAFRQSKDLCKLRSNYVEARSGQLVRERLVHSAACDPTSHCPRHGRQPKELA